MNAYAICLADHVGAALVDDLSAASHVFCTPAQLHRLLDDQAADDHHRVVFVVAGDRLSPGSAEAAEVAGHQVHHYYGAAQLSFVAWGRDAESLRLFPEVRATTIDGELWASSPWLCLREEGAEPVLRTIERDGELSILGNDEVIVKADGVYSTFAAATKIDPPMLNLPAKIEVGSTWPSQQTVKNTEGKEIKIDMSNKVVRKEKLKVAGGEFECFVTSTTGSMQTDDKIAVNGTTWYAPGFGVVKLVINIKSKKGEQVDTIELTSQG